MADTAAKLYGCLDLFLLKVELNVIAAALAIEDALEDRAPTEQEMELMQAALAIHGNAVAESAKAVEKLKAHARALG